MLTAVAGRLTGSAALFDADWNGGLPGNLATGAKGRLVRVARQCCCSLAPQEGA